MDPSEEIKTLEMALDAAAEEARNMAAELGRLDRVSMAAASVVGAWRKGLLVEDHIVRLERALNDLTN